MDRREFLKKTGAGITGALTSRLSFTSSKQNGISPNFETIRSDFPPLKKFRAYMDTAFVGLMPKQVKAALSLHGAGKKGRCEFLLIFTTTKRISRPLCVPFPVRRNNDRTKVFS